jgi:lipoic acid synthetase
VRDVRCSYDQSLAVLARAKARGRTTKSSIMVGLGETDAEVTATMRHLRDAGVDILTIGQYLRPTPKHHEVRSFVEPSVFDDWQAQALEMGFLYAASGPLVRSSYRAAEVFVRTLLGEGRPEQGKEVVSRALAERLAEARRAASQASARATPGDVRLVPAAALVRGGESGSAGRDSGRA